MDSGKGKFIFTKEEGLEALKEEYPNHGGVFYEGEELKIKGSRFKVHSIKPKRLILKLLERGKMTG